MLVQHLLSIIYIDLTSVDDNNRKMIDLEIVVVNLLLSLRITEAIEIKIKDEIVKPRVIVVRYDTGISVREENDVVYIIDSIKGGTFAK